MFEKFEINDILVSNWGQYQGEYRGSWFTIPNVEFGGEFTIPIDPHHLESTTIAKLICESRDLWKQNEVDAIAYMIKQVLQRIDEKK